MKRILAAFTAVSVLASATCALAGTEQRYGWTISASSADPFANTSTPTFGLRTVYLWYDCSTIDGMAAAEFDIVSTSMTHAGTLTQNGFLNAGSHASLLLAVGGCPLGPVVAAHLLMIDLGGTICLAPSPAGNRTTVDCNPVPAPHPIDWVGFSTGIGPACGDGDLCPPDAVESTSWGQLKSLYR